MTDLERKLAEAVYHAAPDELDVILSRCGEKNGSVMELKALQTNQNIIEVEAVEVKSGKKWGRWLGRAGAGGGRRRGLLPSELCRGLGGLPGCEPQY